MRPVFPVVERGDADAELLAEVGNGHICGLLARELTSPPFSPFLATCRPSQMQPLRFLRYRIERGPGAGRLCPASNLPAPRHAMSGIRLARPPRMVRPNGYDVVHINKQSSAPVRPCILRQPVENDLPESGRFWLKR